MNLQVGNITLLPILHHTMESAVTVRQICQQLSPDCVAVELPQALEATFLRAAARLPDVSCITLGPLVYLAEATDPAFEGLRYALETGMSAFCIDAYTDQYPLFQDQLPDPYAIARIGLKAYYEAYLAKASHFPRHPLDEKRELHIARRLKELSLTHDRILFLGGFHHIQAIVHFLSLDSFPVLEEKPLEASLASLTEESAREVLAEYGFLQMVYEKWRQDGDVPPDRQKALYGLLKGSAYHYLESTGLEINTPTYLSLMKYLRNLAFSKGRLQPNLYEILVAARSSVSHQFAYEVWKLATDMPFLRNVDNLPEISPTAEEVWGGSKKIHFQLKQKSEKGKSLQRKKDAFKGRFSPPSPFSLCSYPPEDLKIESLGTFLKQKSLSLMSEEGAKSIPFLSSLEDGLDARETLRKIGTKTLYVKASGRPPGMASAVVVIFDEDYSETDDFKATYPWKTTWLGEHNQESDMAFYATSLYKNIVGPGISRCEYGGFMLSSPPRRLDDIWHDPDYFECGSKAEVLLAAAVDYAVGSSVVYVAAKPPSAKVKSKAARYGKKIIYLPIGSISREQLERIRIFHVLGGHETREIAGDYIF